MDNSNSIPKEIIRYAFYKDFDMWIVFNGLYSIEKLLAVHPTKEQAKSTAQYLINRRSENEKI